MMNFFEHVRVLWWALFICAPILLIEVSAGPDGNWFSSCDIFHKFLSAYELQNLRTLVQGIQSSDASLGALRLGRWPYLSGTEATPSEAELTDSKNAMSSKLRNMLESARIPLQAGLSGTDAAVALAISCMSQRLVPAAFTSRPLVSLLLNYFKRPQVVKVISANLRAACTSVSIRCEVVVNVDNPHEGAIWAEEAGFVVPVFSANLHEARGYNRAARLARGKYLVIWQDDQIPPTDGAWVLRMIRLFETYPKLGILGMNTYRMCRQREGNNRIGKAGWNIDPRTNITWTYVHFTDFAPMAILASMFWELGGLEEGISQRGDCGIVGDWELCARAWVAGWQVAHFHWDGRGAAGGGGTHTSVGVLTCWNRQMWIGQEIFSRRFVRPGFFDEMCERVWALNMLTFTLSSPDKCPYGNQTRGWANCTAPLPEQRAALAAQLQI
ncbi:hypothetical protein VaNZ11_008523 [Volvox africanus]|uniref:Glycosyltransferase 2-like domain-containing protein n=1 Tax=Volvox africanus TaxID=51714 RepID=A0ABQ5S5B1_9CHLO|nr:hypothetical protein VaNZ11_008523 [Volvox africanus]